MQKTKLGITVGALGAFTYFAGIFGGYVVAVLLAGYVLLFEENAWLRRSVVKAVTLLAWFSVVSALINLIPDLFDYIDKVAVVFNGYFNYDKLSQVFHMLNSAMDLAEKILFLLLGFYALRQRTIVIPGLDTLVSKLTSKAPEASYTPDEDYGMEYEDEDEDDVRHCPSCGVELEEDAMFCTNCGKRV